MSAMLISRNTVVASRAAKFTVGPSIGTQMSEYRGKEKKVHENDHSQDEREENLQGERIYKMSGASRDVVAIVRVVDAHCIVGRARARDFSAAKETVHSRRTVPDSSPGPIGA